MPSGEPGSRRILALWCPDWPAMAAAAEADLPPLHPVAVLSANRVVACSASARAAGVRRGMRKRQAQAACTEMTVVAADENRDGRLFEPVVAAVAEVIPALEVLRPGLLVIAGDRAARYFGGMEALAEELVDVVSACGIESQVGIADEIFTAVLAARHGHQVEPGGDREYLAGRPVADLAVEPSMSDPSRADLVELLRRLGIGTIGAFADMSVTDVATRFARDAVVAHRLANAVPGRVPSSRGVPAELDVDHTCDPPVDRIDVAAFIGRTLADVLHRRLRDAAVACTRLTIIATTERGQQHSRTWRCAQPLTPETTADRIRWQLEGWLTGAARPTSPRVEPRAARSSARPDSPIVRLRLEPVEVVEAGALHYQLTDDLSRGGLAGEPDVEERARRSLVRIQGLLGGDAVRIPVLSGGRGPAERITMVSLGDEPVPRRDPSAPWPGRLPQPSPTVLVETAIHVLDAVGQPVKVTDRGAFTAEPVTVALASSRARRSSWGLCWWAGPWPVGGADRPAGASVPTGAAETGLTARAQVLLDDSRALLLCYRAGEWIVEGVYE
ncbi:MULTISPECIES: DNA polymerase Y family protein [unclassified Gordonia (in: high G+C Gram-positive bacteria)]|uniref:DNA polymerase Y family protein n=1 Tax=Gordonia TaxID=2053 RepID=UPI001B82622E|nr:MULTISPECIES: DNA polymerase Y family protein [unclassified Gordonia (in: high G+C Gram-positive bacteria)]MBR7190743.1 DNA polymerase Y family protein [Gordonia sp. SCSIO 19800]MCX2752811.1 DNA polymerase Y family protein [Gordonia sp. 4N]MDT0220416.1 DNA polymerase Y family protein [Gordonia sp. AC31]